MAGGERYDDPNFLLIRFQHPVGAAGNQGSISAASEATFYIGSSLKVSHKAAVLGVAFQVDSGPVSAVGTNSINVSRVDSAGTESVWGSLNVTTSLGASMANDVVDISLASAMTLASLSWAAILSSGAASAHKVIVIKNIVWRYRLLPQDLPQTNLG
jgi:hypothetical protein